MTPGSSTTTAPAVRRRNPRGQGHLLHDEIIAGAASLIERTGNEQSVTLRAVAREIGIAAPSIAPHFTDPAQIIDAVIAAELDSLTDAMSKAAATSTDPFEALLATSRAYVAFGRDHPNRYRMIYGRRYLGTWDESQPMPQTGPVMNRIIELCVGLVQGCIDAGRSASTDAVSDMASAWMFLHGLVTLPLSIPSLPWPEIDELLTRSLTLLLSIEPVPRSTTRRALP